MQNSQEVAELYHQQFTRLVKTHGNKPALCGVTRVGDVEDISLANPWLLADDVSSKNAPLVKKTWTYNHLNNLSTSLAIYLSTKKNVNNNPDYHMLESLVSRTAVCSVVATYLGNSMDAVMANIAIHKIGAGILNLTEILSLDAHKIQILLQCLEVPASASIPYKIDCLLTTWVQWQPIHDCLLLGSKLLTVKNLVFLDRANIPKLQQAPQYKNTILWCASDAMCKPIYGHVPDNHCMDSIAYINRSVADDAVETIVMYKDLLANPAKSLRL